MDEGVAYTVFIHTCRHVISRCLYLLIGIAHGHPDACCMEYAHVVAAVAESAALLRADSDMLRQSAKGIPFVSSPHGDVCKMRIPPGCYAVRHGRKDQLLVVHAEERGKLENRPAQQRFYRLVYIDVVDP